MVLILGAAAASLIGWTLVGRWARGWIPALALGFPAGVAALSLQMLVYSMLRLPWHPALLLLPWAPLCYLRLRGAERFRRPAAPNWIEWLALAAMAPVLWAWLSYERVMPLTTRGWDAWAIWLFKARAFYLDGQIASFLGRAGEFTVQPSYPLLVPLFGAFVYRLAGAPVDHLAKAISPCFFLALLGSFYWLGRRAAPRPVALVFTAMLANLHMVDIVAFELAGYADTALSVYMLIGAGFLYAWLRDDQPGDLWMASLFSSMAAWTKNEGLFFLAGAGVVAALRLGRRRARDPRCSSCPGSWRGNSTASPGRTCWPAVR